MYYNSSRSCVHSGISWFITLPGREILWFTPSGTPLLHTHAFWGAFLFPSWFWLLSLSFLEPGHDDSRHDRHHDDGNKPGDPRPEPCPPGSFFPGLPLLYLSPFSCLASVTFIESWLFSSFFWLIIVFVSILTFLDESLVSTCLMSCKEFKQLGFLVKIDLRLFPTFNIPVDLARENSFFLHVKAREWWSSPLVRIVSFAYLVLELYFRTCLYFWCLWRGRRVRSRVVSPFCFARHGYNLTGVSLQRSLIAASVQPTATVSVAIRHLKEAFGKALNWRTETWF